MEKRRIRRKVKCHYDAKNDEIYASNDVLRDVYLPAALALYLTTASAVGYLQNYIIFKQDSKEMQEIADKKSSQKSKASTKIDKRVKKATEARVTRIKAKD